MYYIISKHEFTKYTKCSIGLFKVQDGGYIREGFNGFYFSGSVLGNQEFYQIILIAHGAAYMAFEICIFGNLSSLILCL